MGELISNAYDADADKVTIEFSSNPKSIKISDNGHGMTQKELNNDFLVIGKNRREGDKDCSPKGRKVTGRKGLGKLAMFGIADILNIKSIKNNRENELEIEYGEMLERSKGEYHPKSIQDNIDRPDTPSRTIITLRDIRRKTKIDDKDIKRFASSIALRLNFFSKNDFIVEMNLDGKNKVIVNQEFRERQFTWQFKWDIEKDIFLDNNEESKNMKSFMSENQIAGYIASTEIPRNRQSSGLALLARGKMVNNFSFYDLQTSNNHAYSYLTGEIYVDYIDDIEDDLISTPRDSLVWSNPNPQLDKLKEFLQSAIKLVVKDWNERRRKKNREKIEKKTSTPIKKWLSKLTQHDRSLAKKIIDGILEDANLDEKRAVDLIDYVQGAFEFRTFKDFAASMSDTNIKSDKIIELIKEWNLVEAKEFQRICIGRLETIKKMKNYIEATSEESVKEETVRKFLKKFPWLLEPRAHRIEEEVRYTELAELLQKEFPDEDKPSSDRRIDLLCLGFYDDIYVVELKRITKTINRKDIGQIEDYVDRVRNHKKLDAHRCKGYIIGKELASNYRAEHKMKRAAGNGIYVKGYKDLLLQAQKYHQEFIALYEKTTKLRQ